MLKLNFAIIATFIISTFPHSLLSAPKNAIRILIIHSYSQEYPWTKGQHEGFISSLQNDLHHPLQIETEYLDTKRVNFETEYRQDFFRYLQVKYSDYVPDAIYVTDDNALQFGLLELAKIYPKIPLFFSGVNDFHSLSQLDNNQHTGVFERKESLPNLHLINELFGDISDLLVVGDGSPTYSAIEREMQQDFAKHSDLKVTYIADQSLDKILQQLETLKGNSILMSTLGSIKDSSGQVLALQEIIEGIVSASNGIILSMEDVYILDGILGGYVTSSYAQGSVAGKLMSLHLSGTSMDTLKPILRSPNEFIFNDHMLQKLNIQLPGSLASNARIINPRLSFIESNWRLVTSLIYLLVGIIIFSLAFYLYWIYRANKRLKQQSIELLQQGEKLEQSETALREKSTYLNSVLEASSKIGFIATNLDYHICYYNDTAARIFDMNPIKMKGIELSSLHNGMGNEANPHLWTALKNDFDQGEYRFLLKQSIGTKLQDIDARISPMKDECNQLIGYLLMVEIINIDHDV